MDAETEPLVALDFPSMRWAEVARIRTFLGFMGRASA